MSGPVRNTLTVGAVTGSELAGLAFPELIARLIDLGLDADREGRTPVNADPGEDR